MSQTRSILVRKAPIRLHVMKFLKILPLGLIALVATVLSSCASSGSTSTGYTSPTASSPFSSWYDSPMAQQIRMQEAQSRVMRSMIPF